MIVFINGIETTIPSSLSEITLRQRINFQAEHGALLDQMIASIATIEDPDEKEIESALFQFEKMYRTVSFFSGISLEVLKESEFIDKLANIYFQCLHCLFEEEKDLGLQNEFLWKDELWTLAPPTLKNGDQMTFGEMIDSKQMIQDMIKLGKNRWECLAPLCAIFLRRKDEAYQESFIYPDSDRINLMMDIPMNIALEVSFFLTNSQSIFMNLFQSSFLREQKEAAST